MGGTDIEYCQQPNKKKKVGIFTLKLRSDEKAHWSNSITFFQLHLLYLNKIRKMAFQESILWVMTPNIFNFEFQTS